MKKEEFKWGSNTNMEKVDCTITNCLIAGKMKW